MNYYQQKTPAELFHDAHGGDCIRIDGCLVYSDGAMRDATYGATLIEPDADPLKRAQVQLKYREELLRRAVEDFQECKRNLLSLAEARARDNLGAPDGSAVEQLRRLADAVTTRTADYEEAERRVEACKPEHLKNRDAENARRQSSCNDFIATVKSIKV